MVSGASTFADLPRNHFGAILADPPWHFRSWSERGRGRAADQHYRTMSLADIACLPVGDLAADDCVLFLWATWPMLESALGIIKVWDFQYKTCAFAWMKADPLRLWSPPWAGLGYWTRANTETCLLATRGNPKRINRDVSQAILEPRRQHSRKPDCVHGRIERLVAGPYLELFARQQRPGWSAWGNETDKFDPIDDISKSVAEGFRTIRERKANGGPGWNE